MGGGGGGGFRGAAIGGGGGFRGGGGGFRSAAIGSGFRGGFGGRGFRSAAIGSGFRGGGFRTAAIGPGSGAPHLAGVASASVVLWGHSCRRLPWWRLGLAQRLGLGLSLRRIRVRRNSWLLRLMLALGWFRVRQRLLSAILRICSVFLCRVFDLLVSTSGVMRRFSDCQRKGWSECEPAGTDRCLRRQLPPAELRYLREAGSTDPR